MPLMIGCPKVSGAGCGGVGGDAAKLTMASNAPRQQRVKAAKARGLKRPDCAVDFFFMEISFFVTWCGELSLTIRKLCPGWMGEQLKKSRQIQQASTQMKTNERMA